MTSAHPDDPTQDFDRLVNFGPAELKRWLATEETRSVGMTHGAEQEAVGHQSGRRTQGE